MVCKKADTDSGHRVMLKCYRPLHNYCDLAHKTMHGYSITRVLKHPPQMNLKYKGFQQFAPKNFFEFVHIFCCVFGPLCDVTS